MKKSGQMEMIGLMLLVIVAGLAIVLGLVYMSSKFPARQAHESFGEKGIANNFVTVISNIDISVCNTDFSNLVKDCATKFEPGFPLEEQGSIKCEEETLSCYYLNETARKILEKTLDEWKMSYRFMVQREGLEENIVEISAFGCSERGLKEAPGRQIIPLFPLPQEAYIVLEICR